MENESKKCRRGLLTPIPIKKISFLIIYTIIFILNGQTVLAVDTPEQVYEKYYQAIKEGKFEKVASFTTKDKQNELKKFSPQEKAKMFHLLQLMAPREYKVTKRVITGEKAYLWLYGKVLNPFENAESEAFGKVEFLIEEGVWKIHEERWQTNPFKE